MLWMVIQKPKHRYVMIQNIRCTVIEARSGRAAIHQAKIRNFICDRDYRQPKAVQITADLDLWF